MYIHKCVKSSRFFTNRLLEALRESNSNFITISKDIQQDIQWLLKFIPQFNGYSQYVKLPVQYMHTIAIDACLTGVGGVWGNLVYTAQLPEEWVGNSNYNINHFEMVNLVVAIRLWGKHWQHQNVKIYIDNASVVQVCNTGYTREKFLGACIMNIWLHTSIWDINLDVNHIAGYKNKTADILSRWQHNDNNVIKLHGLVNNPSWCDVSTELFHIDSEI